MQRSTEYVMQTLVAFVGVIRVQPTALARRRFGITRGSKRVGAGNPRDYG